MSKIKNKWLLDKMAIAKIRSRPY